MALGDTITLADSAAVNKTFNRTGGGVKDAAYIESTASTTDRRLLNFKYQDGGKGVQLGTILKRKLIQARHVKFNSTLGKDESATVNVTITHASSGALARSDYDHLIAFAKNVLSNSTLMDRIFREEA